MLDELRRQWNWRWRTLRRSDDAVAKHGQWKAVEEDGNKKHLEEDLGKEVLSTGFSYGWRQMEVAAQDSWIDEDAVVSDCQKILFVIGRIWNVADVDNWWGVLYNRCCPIVTVHVHSAGSKWRPDFCRWTNLVLDWQSSFQRCTSSTH